MEAEATGTEGGKISVPAYIRLKNNKTQSGVPDNLEDDDLDVPTFLRKQVD